MIWITLIRFRNDIPILYLESSDNVLRGHGPPWVSSTLINDINKAITLPVCLSLKSRVIRGVSRNDFVHEIYEDSIAGEYVWGNWLVRFQWTREHANNGLWRQALREGDIR